MVDSLRASPLDIPFPEAIINFNSVQQIQDAYVASNPSVSAASGIELFPNDPYQYTKNTTDIVDITYSRARLPDEDNGLSYGNNSLLRYSEVASTYIGSDGNYYVATTGRLYVPVTNTRFKGSYEELDGTLWAPGTGTLPPGYGSYINDVLGTYSVGSSAFFDIRLATPEEIAAAQAYVQQAIDNGFTLGNDGIWSPPVDHCFTAETPVQMWPLDPSIKPRADGSYDEALVLSKVWEKPISEVKVGDTVVAYDDRGKIAPKRVTRTVTNTATHLLDFWGTGVTPGHAYYCADGTFKDQHVPIMDILRTDGAFMRADGTIVRAATNCEVGSAGDMMIHISATKQKPDGSWTPQKAGKARFGTRIILPDGRHMSFMEMATSEGWQISDDGYMVGMMKGEDGSYHETKFLFPYAHGEDLPKPEDYILARSDVTLGEIYTANEWEQIGTRMPAPADMVGLNTNHTSTLLQPSKPEPNIPPAFANHPDAPRRGQERTMNRKQRKAMEAKQRQADKLRKRVLN